MRTLHRLFALLLLLVYASSGTAVVPAVVLLLAELDGSHQVIVSQSGNGTQIRLHHREGDFTPEVTDHSHHLAKCLVCLSKRAVDGDHNLATTSLSGSIIDSRDKTKRETRDVSALNLQAIVILTPGQPRAGGFSRIAVFKDTDLHMGKVHPSVHTTRLLI